jgi:hypothetical protein
MVGTTLSTACHADFEAEEIWDAVECVLTRLFQSRMAVFIYSVGGGLWRCVSQPSIYSQGFQAGGENECAGHCGAETWGVSGLSSSFKLGHSQPGVLRRNISALPSLG